MNLEILFWASKNGGGQNLYDIAVNHAYRTLQDHVRADGSTYHVVDYDAATGQIRNKDTWQGYNSESTSARGQAWGLYGFTMAYRETGNQDFLNTAELLADYFVDNLPQDSIPYWDFEAPTIPNTNRDSSAAAIAASALFELSGFEALSLEKRQKYLTAAQDIIESFSSDYLAMPSDRNAILLHSVGNHSEGREGDASGSQIDVSHIYADMYFIEAVLRSSGQFPFQ